MEELTIKLRAGAKRPKPIKEVVELTSEEIDDVIDFEEFNEKATPEFITQSEYGTTTFSTCCAFVSSDELIDYRRRMGEEIYTVVTSTDTTTTNNDFWSTT